MGILAHQDKTFLEKVTMQLSLLREILEIRFVTAIVGGFFLVAYAWWPWRIGMDAFMASLYSTFILILGGSQLFEGYHRLVNMISDVQVKKPLIIPGRESPVLPHEGLLRITSGAMLFVWAVAYFNPANRVAFHWPLDLAVTIFSGALLVYYWISDSPEDTRSFFQKLWSTEEPEPSPQP